MSGLPRRTDYLYGIRTQGGRRPLASIFISYARSTEPVARRIGDALRALGYGVWRDDDLDPIRDDPRFQALLADAQARLPKAEVK